MYIRDFNEIIKILILRKEHGDRPLTLLAVCPNSSAVLEAAIKAAARNRSVMLFAATLNQVDVESSYTGWTPTDFVHQMQRFAKKYQWSGALYPCLDHGGPWLKDLHTLEKLPFSVTMDKVKNSISACIQAGYKLLHIDPTVDRTLPLNTSLPLELVVDRTLELMLHAEKIRSANRLPRLAYEVGTEEVHGGLVDINRFINFLDLLQIQLNKNNLSECWPCLFVAQIGTDLHTTVFNPQAARDLYSILSPKGSMVKGHYTDWVENPEDYPITGMGAANVGPEFTAEEYVALKELEKLERELNTHIQPSYFIETLENVVIEEGRWKKWLLPDEVGLDFKDLSVARKEWLLTTGSRYIWTNDRVITARNLLYKNLSNQVDDPHAYVVERITQKVEKYLQAFNLQNSMDILG
jgi:tagatose-1,6-bisphosphate aldolase non-catalytic subunit AgaZ/GatZ